jgi:hypothetical protein
MSITVVSGTEPAQVASPEAEKETVESSVAEESAEAVEETQEESESTEVEDGSQDELESKSEEETDEAAKEKPAKKSGFKRKIEKFEKTLSLKEQEIAYWKEQALKSKPEQKEEVKETKPVATNKPLRDDFESLEDYLEAGADWKLESKLALVEAKKTEETLKSEYQKKQTTYQEKLTSVKKELEDFDDVIQDFIADHGDIKFSAALNELIMESDVGPKVIYQLAKDKALLDRINSMSPLTAAKEFGKLEETLTKPKAKIEVKRTNAPPPISPLGSSKGTVKKTIYDADKMTQSEYEALRREQMKKRA